MKFHAIQHDVIPNDPEATEKHIETLMDQGPIDEGDFVVLPEMTTTGFSNNLEVMSKGNGVKWG